MLRDAVDRWSLAPAERAYAVSLARVVVEQTAPHELPLFEVRSRRFYRRPLPRVRHDVLRSDLGTTLACVTDAALAAGHAAVVIVAGLAVERAAEQASSRLLARIRRRFRPPAAPLGDRAWAPQELARIRAACIAAGQNRVPADEIEVIADRIVARLALGAAGERDDRHPAV